jgi:hypothetical protein
MHKRLLRLLKQATEKVRSKTSAWLIRTIAEKAAGARNQHDLEKIILRFSFGTTENLEGKGQTPEEIIAEFLEVVNVLRDAWAFAFAQWWESFRRSIISVLNWLKPSLHNVQIIARIDLVLEKVKCRLIEKYWPPSRQRCDFIAAPAIN